MANIKLRFLVNKRVNKWNFKRYLENFTAISGNKIQFSENRIKIECIDD